jgi:hypothetical protein
MSTTTKPSKPKSIPSTPEERIAAHQKQMRLQVWLPLGICLLLVLFVAFIAFAGTIKGTFETARWANISAIFLMIPNIITSLIWAAILILAVRGLYLLSKLLPGWLFEVQALFAQIAAIIHIIADRIVTPVMSVNSFTAGLNAFKKKIIH